MNIVTTPTPAYSAANHLAIVIKDHLDAGHTVLWLLSGGSGITAGIEAARQLTGTDLRNLYVTLTDERYGPVGHSDENWQQLLSNNLTLTGATVYRPLRDENLSITTDEFGAWIMQHMEVADYRIGLFGIGDDGHTAGIKPHSSAVEATLWADSFSGDDFERITITPFAISQLDEAVIQASGTNKLATLSQLAHKKLPLSDQPAQILKTIPKATLYTDNEKV